MISIFTWSFAGVFIVSVALTLTVARHRPAWQVGLGVVHYIALTYLILWGYAIYGLQMEFDEDGNVVGFADHLRIFERTLRETGKEADQFNVALLGDSTHNNRENVANNLPIQVKRNLNAEPKSKVNFVGYHKPASDIYDFYLLSQRLMYKGFDMIVIPVNLRAMTPQFDRNFRSFVPEVDRYLRFSEYPFLFLSGATHRDIKLSHAFLDRVDYVYFGQRFRHALYEAKSRYIKRNRKIMEQFTECFEPFPQDFKALINSKHFARHYPDSIEEDYHKVEMFQRLKRLAYENDTYLLLYCVPMNPIAVEVLDFNADPLFVECERLFGAGSHVKFIYTEDLLRGEDFHLRLSHMINSGIMKMAGKISHEILVYKQEILDERAEADGI